MKIYDAATQAAFEKPRIYPYFLIRINIVSANDVLHISTGPTSVWQGKSYESVGASIEGLDVANKLDGPFIIRLPNDDNSATAAVKNNRINDSHVTAWGWNTGGDPVPLFDGRAGSAPTISTEEVEIIAMRLPQMMSTSPSVILDHHFCSSFTRPGEEVTVGEITYRHERS